MKSLTKLQEQESLECSIETLAERKSHPWIERTEQKAEEFLEKQQSQFLFNMKHKSTNPVIRP